MKGAVSIKEKPLKSLLTFASLKGYSIWRNSKFYRFPLMKRFFAYTYFIYKDFIDKDELNYCRKMSKSVNTVFDIGANLGWFSYRLAEASSSLRIIACEPLPSNFELLRITVRSKAAVTPLRIAVSSSSSTVYLREDLRSHANARVTDDITQFTAPCETIDQLSSRYGYPDLIKIDTQGSEFEILKGAKLTLVQKRPVIVLEFSGSKVNKNLEIYDYLSENDYLFSTFSGEEIILDEILELREDVSIAAVPKEKCVVV
jgi:FkbM family methyltransferase